MAATIILSESNGAGEVVTDNISNINFGSNDSPNLTPATYPIVIGLNSYVKFLRIKLSALGGSNTIDVLKVYKSAGSYVTGEDILSNANDLAGAYFRTTYSAPTRTPASAVNECISTIMTSLPVSANLSISAAGTANDGNADTPAGTLTVAGTYSQYWTLINRSSGATPAGAGNQKTFTYQWNEA